MTSTSPFQPSRTYQVLAWLSACGGGILGSCMTLGLLASWDFFPPAFLNAPGPPSLTMGLLAKLLSAVGILALGMLYGSLYGLGCLALLLDRPPVEVLAALLSGIATVTICYHDESPSTPETSYPKEDSDERGECPLA